jgi:tetratricopeptide (TPR) repeat protein
MGSVEKALDRVHTALKKSNYRKAITAASRVSQDALKPEQRSHLMDALLAAAASLSDGSDAEIDAYDQVTQLGDTLSEEDVYKIAAQLKVNSALFNKGVVLAQRGDWRQAITVYDDLVSRSGGAPDLGLRENAVRALFNKGASLATQKRLEEAIAVYDELVERFASSSEPTLSEAVGKALINKGIALAELERLSEAIDVLDEVVLRWGESADPSLRERTSKALLNKASALQQLNDYTLALATYEEILLRFGEESDPVLQQQVEIARYRMEDLESSLN